MYVILTSKPGQFRTEPVDGLRPVESFEYLFFGRCKARFVIAELQAPCKVTVIDETPPEVVNHVPTKFLEKFDTVSLARDALRQLVREGDADVTLVST
jgi:hypothetical protein